MGTWAFLGPPQAFIGALQGAHVVLDEQRSFMGNDEQ